MTDNQHDLPTTPDALAGTGAVAPETSQAQPVKEEKKEEEKYYNVKVPTFGTALKQLWKVGKKLAKKADPIADKAIDSLVGGIAKVSGLPDPKTGEQKETPQEPSSNSPQTTPTA